MSFRHALAATIVTLGVALGAGCGPISYAGQIRQASAAVDAARTVRAEHYSPYWWTRATQYLHKARELAGHADFQAANRYSVLAGQAASVAEQEAIIAAKDPAKRPVESAPDDKPAVAPAKDAPAKDAPAKDAPAKDAP